MTTNLTTLLGGVDYSAQKLDGSSESVRIRQLPIKQFPAYLNALEDEPKMVELLCDKPEGWSDSLKSESFEYIVSEGERINQDFFSRWVQRRLARQERLLPGITDRLVKGAASPSKTT